MPVDSFRRSRLRGLGTAGLVAFEGLVFCSFAGWPAERGLALA